MHLYEELVTAKLKIDEQEETEQLVDKLNNIEDIKINLAEAQQLALNDEIGVQSLLISFLSNIQKIANFSSEYKQLYDRVLSLKIEFDDIASEVENFNENLDFDTSKLVRLNDLFKLIYNLQKKHSLKPTLFL